MAARGKCQEAIDTLLQSRDAIHFEISRETGKYEYTVYFDNGVYVHFISVREGLLTVDLRRRGMIDVLWDLAKHDGTRGRVMAYGVAVYFGIEEKTDREIHHEYGASHYEGSYDASHMGDSHADYSYSARDPHPNDHIEESRGSNHADDPHLAHETGEPQAREPIEDFLDACPIETSQISYPFVEGAHSYLIQTAHSIGLDNDTTTVFVAVHYLLQNNTFVELWESEERPGVRQGVVRTHFGVDLHLETEDVARFDVSLNNRVLFGKIVSAVCEDGYPHVFSDGVVYGYVQKRF
ncbi:hypothetical protein LQW54_013142 [Pestalotiopsis sp. IQ-011]